MTTRYTYIPSNAEEIARVLQFDGLPNHDFRGKAEILVEKGIKLGYKDSDIVIAIDWWHREHPRVRKEAK